MEKPVEAARISRNLTTNEELAIAFWNRRPIAVYLNGQEVDRAPRIAHLNQTVVTLSEERMYARGAFEFKVL
jgi:hypothetical protein